MTVATAEMELPRIISLEKVCAQIGVKPRTIEDYLARFDIPLTEFSQKNRGLTEENYRLLIKRATAKREAA